MYIYLIDVILTVYVIQSLILDDIIMEDFPVIENADHISSGILEYIRNAVALILEGKYFIYLFCCHEGMNNTRRQTSHTKYTIPNYFDMGL